MIKLKWLVEVRFASPISLAALVDAETADEALELGRRQLGMNSDHHPIQMSVTRVNAPDSSTA